jgi:hypothetical protein
LGAKEERVETFFKNERISDEQYLRLIRRLPCAVCMKEPPSEAAHIRVNDIRYLFTGAGMGHKPGDQWVLPLCAEHHRTGPEAEHVIGTVAFWEKHGNPFPIAKQLRDLAPRQDLMLQYLFNRYYL